MKNKYIAAFFALTIFACSLAFASENFKMTTHAGFGILHGNIIEEVYSPECRNTGNMLSKLDWEVTAVPYFEAGASFDIFKYINIGIRGRVGIPVDSGNMQDYDWLNSTAKQSDYITGGSSSLIWNLQTIQNQIINVRITGFLNLVPAEIFIFLYNLCLLLL